MIHCGVAHHPVRQHNTACEYCEYSASKLQRSTPAIVSCEQATAPLVGDRIRSTSECSKGDRVTYKNLGKTYTGTILATDDLCVLVNVVGKYRHPLYWWVDVCEDDSPDNARRTFVGYDLRKAV